MTNQEARGILANLEADYRDLNPLVLTNDSIQLVNKRIEALGVAISALQAQDAPDINVGDMIDRKKVNWKLTALVNEFEEILSHIREREVNDSVCGLCEYDGAYIGQSGDWYGECPGFEKDDCFVLKKKYRQEWEEIDG